MEGFIAGLLLGCAFLVNQKDKINPYKRQLEKLHISCNFRNMLKWLVKSKKKSYWNKNARRNNNFSKK